MVFVVAENNVQFCFLFAVQRHHSAVHQIAYGEGICYFRDTVAGTEILDTHFGNFGVDSLDGIAFSVHPHVFVVEGVSQRHAQLHSVELSVYFRKGNVLQIGKNVVVAAYSQLGKGEVFQLQSVADSVDGGVGKHCFQSGNGLNAGFVGVPHKAVTIGVVDVTFGAIEFRLVPYVAVFPDKFAVVLQNVGNVVNRRVTADIGDLLSGVFQHRSDVDVVNFRTDLADRHICKLTENACEVFLAQNFGKSQLLQHI